VSTLSGGQRQAVAVARAAVWGTRLLIMDEPTAALGVTQTAFVLELMRRVRDEKGLAIILISHNLPEVFEVADRVTVLRLGQRVLSCDIAEATTERLVAAQAGLRALPGGST
jgi:ABC-type sugar transport system ATPase subunit